LGGRNYDHLEVMLSELKEQFPHYIKSRRPAAPVKTLEDIIDANRRDGIQQEPMETAQQKGAMSGKAYQRAFARIRRTARDEGIDRVVKTHRLDLLISPAMGPAWTFAEEKTLDVFVPRGMLLASDAGYPVITVPWVT
jgi:amidase